MLTINQDKTMIMNLKNIECIAIGNPLNNNQGKFPILIETTSDNEYVIAEYETEERAKEVLKEIAEAIESWEDLKAGQPHGAPSFKYEIPEE